MIRSFKHKGLARLYENADRKGLSADLVPKIERALLLLDNATRLRDIDIQGFRLHKLTGKLKDLYAISVSGNWRIVFSFENGEVWDVDFVDYH